MRKALCLAAWLMCSALLAAPLSAQEKKPESVKKAEAKLSTSPDDADANLTVGKYLFLTGRHNESFLHLFKGSDAVLKELALKEFAKEPDAVSMGEAWMEASKKNAQLRTAMLERAVFWYGKAWFASDDKTKLRSILTRLCVPPAGYEKPTKKGPGPSGWEYSDITIGYIESEFGHTGKRSAKVLPPGSARAEAYVSTAMMPVLEKKRYTFTAWVFSEKTDMDAKMDVRIYDMDLNPKALLVKGFMIPQDAPFWWKIGGEIEVPEGGFRAMLHFQTRATKGAIWVDDVSIIATDGKECMKNGGLEEK